MVNITDSVLCLSEPKISTNAKYGTGDGPIFFSNVNCQGWERSFTVCSKLSYLHFTCSNNAIAGVLCTDGKEMYQLVFD